MLEEKKNSLRISSEVILIFNFLLYLFSFFFSCSSIVNGLGTTPKGVLMALEG
jgi:hypothetical protein